MRHVEECCASRQGDLGHGHEFAPGGTLAETIGQARRDGYTENISGQLRHDAWFGEIALSVLDWDGRGDVIQLVSAGEDGVFGNVDDVTVEVHKNASGVVAITPCDTGSGN